jgi:N-acetyl-anhydromuramyl-L-alanine amidase AmpD
MVLSLEQKMFKRAATITLAAVLAGCTHNAEDHSDANPPITAPRASATPRQSSTLPPLSGNMAYVPRDWVPSARPFPWKYIVIHHSDTRTGSAEIFRKYHVEQRHWSDLGYHFVIGNGQGASDGLVEVGGRWKRQQIGAHAGVREYNEGIGICLVGDFQVDRPSNAQMQALAKLTAHLMKMYRIPANRVIGHAEAKSGRTNCPGRNLSVAQVRAMAARLVAAESPTLAAEYLARGELLHDAR